MLQHQDESVQGTITEVGVGKSTVDVRVLVDESHESVEAGKAAPDAAEEPSYGAVTTGSLLDLVANPLKDAADQPDDCDYERSEGKSASVIPEGPPQSFADF